MSQILFSYPRSEGENALGAMADQMAEMERVQEEAARHAALVHAVPWVERAAGEPWLVRVWST